MNITRTTTITTTVYTVFFICLK